MVGKKPSEPGALPRWYTLPVGRMKRRRRKEGEKKKKKSIDVAMPDGKESPGRGMKRDEILVYNSGSLPRYRAVRQTEGWLVRLVGSRPLFSPAIPIPLRIFWS